jgi:sarcosine oxidase, subunit delta
MKLPRRRSPIEHVMLLIHCPYCNSKRAEMEFRHCGEAHLLRPADPSATSDDEWTAYLVLRQNKKGVVRERWRHSHGCGRFFNAVRHSVTDQIIATYPAGSAGPEKATDEA